MTFAVDDRLHVEALGSDWLVLVPGQHEVLHLEGAGAEAFVLARQGVDLVPAHLQTAMAGLVELGVVTTDAWSRRRVLQLGGAAAAAGVAMVALPSVAAAASPTTTLGPSTGSVSVTMNLMDGHELDAHSPVDIPVSGTAFAHLYASADRSTTPVATVPVSLPANQTFVTYTFTGVAPGSYFVDIQQPFQSLGDAGVVYSGITIYVDWNFAHRTLPDGWPTSDIIDHYQPVTVTDGGTAMVNVDIQVASGFTAP
ncbi:MAG TPA: hypothetical protein VFN21_10770 [Acidimicrobiales bacterium]|nr:hypothetical protein [Acidimicrobiales bacterium]